MLLPAKLPLTPSVLRPPLAHRALPPALKNDSGVGEVERQMEIQLTKATTVTSWRTPASSAPCASGPFLRSCLGRVADALRNRHLGEPPGRLPRPTWRRQACGTPGALRKPETSSAMW